MKTKEKADVYVAFMAHPPTADYVGNFFGDVAGKVLRVKKLRDSVEHWATRSFEGPDIQYGLARTIASAVSFRGRLPIDKCRINFNDVVLEEGLYSLPYTTAQILNPTNRDVVHRDSIKLLRKIQEDGAIICGLGAAVKSKKVFKSGDFFVGKTGMPISNGNNYTIASCIDVAIATCEKMQIDLANAKVAVVGANGSIGSICAEMIAKYCPNIILFGNPKSGIESLYERKDLVSATVEQKHGYSPTIELSIDLEAKLCEADLVISATDSDRPVVYPKMVKRKSVVVDIARPHDTKRSDRKAYVRAGCLVADGGLVYHEGEIHFKSMDTPPGYGLACSFEPAIIGLSPREHLHDWVETNIDNVLLIKQLAENAGFVVDTQTFRFHYKPIGKTTMDEIMRNAGV